MVKYKHEVIILENDKVFDLLTKMYSDLTDRIDKMDYKIDKMDDKFSKRFDKIENEVVKTNIKIEQEIAPKLVALFDGHIQDQVVLNRLENKLDGLSAMVDIHDIKIAEIKGSGKRHIK